MDHVGIAVQDLPAAIAFFVELGMEVEGRTQVEGAWADQLLGLEHMRADIAVVRTADGRARIELSTFLSPAATEAAPVAPVTTSGIPRLTFVIDDLAEVLDRLRGHGAKLVGEVARYEDECLYCYIRGPEGVIIGLVEELR